MVCMPQAVYDDSWRNTVLWGRNRWPITVKSQLVRIFYRPTDPHKISANFLQDSYFPHSLDSALQILHGYQDRKLPLVKVLLDSTPLEVFLQGLPSLCSLFKGALKPPHFSFSSFCCGSRKPASGFWTSQKSDQNCGVGASIAASIMMLDLDTQHHKGEF